MKPLKNLQKKTKLFLTAKSNMNKETTFGKKSKDDVEPWTINYQFFMKILSNL